MDTIVTTVNRQLNLTEYGVSAGGKYCILIFDFKTFFLVHIHSAIAIQYDWLIEKQPI